MLRKWPFIVRPILELTFGAKIVKANFKMRSLHVTGRSRKSGIAILPWIAIIAIF